jgi:anti-anti-sigma factor
MPEEPQSRQDFQLRAQRDGERLLVALAGELDLTTAPELEETLLNANPYSLLEINLSSLDFIDSSGLRLLLSERDRAGRTGAELRVVGARGAVARVFAISGLDAELHPQLPDPPAAHAHGAPEDAPSAGRFVETYPAVPESVSIIRHALSRWARELGVREEVISALGLAVSEATTNAVVHAYADLPDPGDGTVAVDAEVAEQLLSVTVADEGRGMKPRPDSPGLGLGLPLIAQMAASFEVHEGPAGGTEVRMSFAT